MAVFILYLFTFKEQISFGKVQLVTEGCCRVLHPRAGFKFNSYLQLHKEDRHQRIASDFFQGF